METTMWVWAVGLTQGRSWTLLPDSPFFQSEIEALTWAKTYIEENPAAVKRGLEGIGPKRIEVNESSR